VRAAVNRVVNLGLQRWGAGFARSWVQFTAVTIAISSANDIANDRAINVASDVDENRRPNRG
jgi:hypothetical protein